MELAPVAAGVMLEDDRPMRLVHRDAYFASGRKTNQYAAPPSARSTAITTIMITAVAPPPPSVVGDDGGVEDVGGDDGEGEVA